MSNASIFRVCARHRSASTIWRWSSDSSSVGACFASPAFCTASSTAAARAPCAPPRGGGKSAAASWSTCALIVSLSVPSFERRAVSFSRHICSSSALTVLPSCALRIAPSHRPNFSAHCRDVAPSCESSAASSAASAASSSASWRSSASTSACGRSAPGPGSPSTCPAASAADSRASVCASTSEPPSDPDGLGGTSGSSPASEPPSEPEPSKERIEPARAGAFCAIAARYPSQ